jgi:hypothetical protein
LSQAIVEAEDDEIRHGLASGQRTREVECIERSHGFRGEWPAGAFEGGDDGIVVRLFEELGKYSIPRKGLSVAALFIQEARHRCRLPLKRGQTAIQARLVWRAKPRRPSFREPRQSYRHARTRLEASRRHEFRDDPTTIGD